MRIYGNGDLRLCLNPGSTTVYVDDVYDFQILSGDGFIDNPNGMEGSRPDDDVGAIVSAGLGGSGYVAVKAELNSVIGVSSQIWVYGSAYQAGLMVYVSETGSGDWVYAGSCSYHTYPDFTTLYLAETTETYRYVTVVCSVPEFYEAGLAIDCLIVTYYN
ncbi:MAG: hypothetical protein NWF01_04505 [Candidatus Bathyarchaeota archaeon]|nr:hypothetical protein [Candidatus Bathyarchaeota archaeon]